MLKTKLKITLDGSGYTLIKYVCSIFVLINFESDRILIS